MCRISRRRGVALCVAACCGLVVVVTPELSLAALIGPVESSGYLAYYYRSLSEDDGPENTSHQLGGTVNASTFFGEPWLATSHMSLSLTQDSSETSNTGTQASTDSQLITGDFGLNVLPQSRTPFTLQLQVTDSRVDSEGTGFIPITFLGQEYSTMYLGLRQSYLTDNGGRYLANYDYRTWESNRSGEYEDTTLGFEADLRAPRHRLYGRASLTNNEHSIADRQNETLLLDMSHFYYPVRHFRLDSKASYYDYDRSFLDPNASDTRLTNLNIAQVSSNAFWRPTNYPLSVTAGVRVYAMDGSSGSVSGNEVQNVAMNAGLFYHANQNLRFDASFTSLWGEISGVQDDVHTQQAGFLYQTDWKEVAGFMYQAYLDGDVGHRVDVDSEVTDWSLTAGHGLTRTWWPADRTSSTSLRMNLNQALGYSVASGDVALDSGTGVSVDHSITLAFSQRAWGGNSLAQITAADTRTYSELEDSLGATTEVDSEQQLVNLQLSRDQDLGRRSSITGDISLQYVRVRDETASPGSSVAIDEFDTTTSTGRLMFQHYQLLGLPRLQFVSDYRVSKISTEGAIDREDWENRLAYMIGKLETSVSYRLTETDSRNYDLLYFRLMRRF